MLNDTVQFDEFLHMPCADGTTKRYRFCSLIQHSGTLHGGHYLAHVRRWDTWYDTNNACVRVLEPAAVLWCQMYCAAYETLGAAPGAVYAAEVRQMLPQPMSEVPPQPSQPCPRTSRSRPLQTGCAQSEDNLRSYKNRLDTQAWLTTTDLMCGRRDARKAD